MRVSVLQDNFVRALRACASLIPTGRHFDRPQDGWVRLYTQDNQFFVSACNVVYGAVMQIGAKVDADGACVVDGKALRDLVEKMPADERLDIEHDAATGTLTIAHGPYTGSGQLAHPKTAKFITHDLDGALEVPPAPKVAELFLESWNFRLLLRAIKEVAKIRPEHVVLRAEGDTVTLTGMTATTQVMVTGIGVGFIDSEWVYKTYHIDPAVVIMLPKLSPETLLGIKFTTDGDRIFFVFADGYLVGSKVKSQRVYNGSRPPFCIEIDRSALLLAIRRATIFGGKAVSLVFRDDDAVYVVGKGECGTGETRLAVDGLHPFNVEIKIDAPTLKKVLDGKSKTARLHLSSIPGAPLWADVEKIETARKPNPITVSLAVGTIATITRRRTPAELMAESDTALTDVSRELGIINHTTPNRDYPYFWQGRSISTQVRAWYHYCVLKNQDLAWYYEGKTRP